MIATPHTATSYSTGCRCARCTARHATQMAQYRKRDYLGIASPNDLVQADRSRRWLEYLRLQGMAVGSILRLARISLSTYHRITTVEAHQLRRSVEGRILAVKPTAPDPTAWVPAELTWRRIQGLVALGYTRGWICKQLSVTRIGRTWVSAGVALAVASLCADIGDTPGPSQRARTTAARHGWLPPSYYDDDLRLVAA